MCSSHRRRPEGILICFKEPFCAILFVLDPVSFMAVQVALNHQECLSATMTRRSEERIVDGSLGRAKDLKVNFPKFVQAVVGKHTVPMSHQRCQYLSLILRKV